MVSLRSQIEQSREMLRLPSSPEELDPQIQGFIARLRSASEADDVLGA
jgi:hypothetical protein